MMFKYRGESQKLKYFRDVESVPGGTVSPGGAVQILGCSRPYISKLIKVNSSVRAWMFYSDRTINSGMVEISVVDLVRYALRLGRYKNISEVPLIPQEIKEEVNSIISNEG